MYSTLGIPQLSFEVIYKDEHLIEIETKAWNGYFGGHTRIYTNGDAIVAMGNKLSGFPKDIYQIEDFSFGNPDHAFVGLRFKCIDNMGHTKVEITIIENIFAQFDNKFRNKVELSLPFEPSRIDEFIKELSNLGEQQEGKAVLIGKEF